jgi:hypothetical protein
MSVNVTCGAGKAEISPVAILKLVELASYRMS